MKARAPLLFPAVALLAAALSRSLYAAEPDNKALPFGIGTPGGSGGRILRVTNLNADGKGSFRAALETEGPRTIVFDVGGVIDLEKKHLVIRKPFLTVAGQTAPPPGITVIKGCVLVKTHDVIIQHIAARPGDAREGKRSGWETDAITTSAHGEAKGQVYNVIIDHCSGTWATDENMSVSGPRNNEGNQTTHDVTFRNCIIAEGLLNSTHKKGRHSRGSLIMDGCSRIALIGNLFAHNNQRNPLFKGGSSGIVVNNLIVNPGNHCIHMTDIGHGKKLGKPVATIVGNVMIPGKNTRTEFMNGPASVYARDNLILESGKKKVVVDNRGEKRALWPEGLEALPSDRVPEHVLENAGMRPAERDPVDERIVRQCREGKGRIIDSQEDVGGYPAYAPTRRKLKIPEDNVEKWLEKLASELGADEE